MTLTGKTKVLREKLVSVPLHPEEIPHKLTWDWTWVSAVIDWTEPKNTPGTILNSPYTFNQMDPQIHLTWTTLILVNVKVKSHCGKPTFHTHTHIYIYDYIICIMSATRLLIRCTVKYCKLLVQNCSWWWTVTSSKHVEDILDFRLSPCTECSKLSLG